MGRQQYPKMTAEQERSLAAVTRFQRAADGSYISNATSRTELDGTVAAARAADCDVSVFVDGLSAETLALCAQEICDLAVDQGVTVRFRHRGRILCLAEISSDASAAAAQTSGRTII